MQEDPLRAGRHRKCCPQGVASTRYHGRVHQPGGRCYGSAPCDAKYIAHEHTRMGDALHGTLGRRVGKRACASSRHPIGVITSFQACND